MSTVTTTGNGAGTSNYTYDNAGNAATRPGQTLAWNALGKLSTTAASGQNQTNIYTPDGQLLLQSDPTNGSTLFLDETQLHIAAGATTASAVRTYTVADQTIAERVTKAGVSGSVVYFMATDANNTVYLEVVASSGATAGNIAQRFVDPYGNPRGSSVPGSSNDGYLNKPIDAFNGLTQLGVRAYDPTIGKFLSVDSILDPSNPLQNNGYDYSGNNPETKSDPSGNEPIDLSCTTKELVGCRWGAGRACPLRSRSLGGPDNGSDRWPAVLRPVGDVIDSSPAPRSGAAARGQRPDSVKHHSRERGSRMSEIDTPAAPEPAGMRIRLRPRDCGCGTAHIGDE